MEEYTRKIERDLETAESRVQELKGLLSAANEHLEVLNRLIDERGDSKCEQCAEDASSGEVVVRLPLVIAVWALNILASQSTYARYEEVAEAAFDEALDNIQEKGDT